MELKVLAKPLIDAIRVRAHIPLPLNRSRDLIARLVYARPYSAAAAAEQRHKLPAPSLDPRRTEELIDEYGAWVEDVSLAAAPLINNQTPLFRSLLARDIFEIAQLAAERYSAMRVRRSNAGFRNFSSIDWEAELKIRQPLATRLAALQEDALLELKALSWLGRRETEDFASVLAHARQVGSQGDCGYLSGKAELHRQLARGLVMLGETGKAILDAYPAMRSWVTQS